MTSSAMPTTTLRLIATTDLHMAMTGFDLLGTSRGATGLAALGPVIVQARDEAEAALVFDIGDAFQGSALTDDLDPAAPHPMQAAMNAVGYDAQTVGNHDLDFGLDAIRAIAAQAEAPVICANLLDLHGVPIFDPYRIVEVGTPLGPLRVGLVGVLPPRVMRWNRHHLAARARVSGCAEAVRGVLPELLMAGADIIVVLAHCGIVPDGHPDLDEQAALPIAAIDGVDAVLCGHQHRVFPGPGFPAARDIDPIAGTLAGTPALMAGWAGERLGLLDLMLERQPSGWRVTGHRASFRTPSPTPCAIVERIAAPHVARTRARLAQRLSHVERSVDTLFAPLYHGAAVRLMQAALMAQGRRRIETDLPMLAVASPFRCGGRAGPLAYTRIAAGPLTHGSVADLCPFSNRIVAVEATGAQIIDWLEMASGYIAHLRPDLPDQPMVNPDMPGYNFDAVLGLTYSIDPTQPHRFTSTGAPADLTSRRIVDLRHAGRPLAPAQRFVVIANGYRVFGGGNFPGMEALRLVEEDLGGTAQVIADWLGAHPEGITLPPPSWHLRPSVPVRATFRTGAGAPDADDLAPHGLRKAGVTPEGWHDWDVELSA